MISAAGSAPGAGSDSGDRRHLQCHTHDGNDAGGDIAKVSHVLSSRQVRRDLPLSPDNARPGAKLPHPRQGRASDGLVAEAEHAMTGQTGCLVG